MAWQAQDDLDRARAALQELEHRRVVAAAELTLERTRGLLELSRNLLETNRQLLADWQSRRSSVRQFLNRPRRGPRRLSPNLPKTA